MFAKVMVCAEFCKGWDGLFVFVGQRAFVMFVVKLVVKAFMSILSGEQYENPVHETVPTLGNVGLA